MPGFRTLCLRQIKAQVEIQGAPRGEADVLLRRRQGRTTGFEISRVHQRRHHRLTTGTDIDDGRARTQCGVEIDFDNGRDSGCLLYTSRCV